MGGRDLTRCTAFIGSRCIASGEMAKVVMKVKEVIDRGEDDLILIFDDLTSEVIEVDFRGTINDVLKRLEKPTAEGGSLSTPVNASQNVQRGPGRPKLGVVSREVTLLPRHWEWLNNQPGGASVALRKLVEQAKRSYSDRDEVRHSQNAAYKFMSAMAGNLAGFEEATRALFAGDSKRFDSLVASWPTDVRDHARKISYVALHSLSSGNSA